MISKVFSSLADSVIPVTLSYTFLFRTLCVCAYEHAKVKQECDGRWCVWMGSEKDMDCLAETWFVKKDWSTGKSELSLWDWLFQSFWGFLPSGIKTCRWDSSLAEVSAVPWLQSHFQQPFWLLEISWEFFCAIGTSWVASELCGYARMISVQ